MNAEISRLYNALSIASARVLKKRFILTSGDRTCSRQLELSGPTSYHVVGEAFDAQLYPYNRTEQEYLGNAAIANGFRWGGKFNQPEYDDVHFDNGNRTRPGTCVP